MSRHPGARPPGRPSRGNRYTFHLRLSLDQWERYFIESRARGLALSDYVCAVLAEAHGLEVPNYIQPKVPDLAVVRMLDQPALDVEARRQPDRICLRIPVEHRLAYLAQAGDTSLTEYVRDCLARIHDLEHTPTEEADRLIA